MEEGIFIIRIDTIQCNLSIRSNHYLVSSIICSVSSTFTTGVVVIFFAQLPSFKIVFVSCFTLSLGDRASIIWKTLVFMKEVICGMSPSGTHSLSEEGPCYPPLTTRLSPSSPIQNFYPNVSLKFQTSSTVMKIISSLSLIEKW